MTMSDTEDTPPRALWIERPGQAALQPVELPPVGPADVLVRSRFGAVSRGTEALVMQGRVPESERERMRCPFQEGAFPGPVKYGYITVGVVETGAFGLRGRDVFCLHPHQERFVVPADAVHVLPDGLPPDRAVLAANMETAVNVLWDAEIGPGDRVAVIGAGVVGCLAAHLAAAVPGAAVSLVDIDPGKAAVATALGLDFRSPDSMPRDCDVVIHVSGHPAGLETALTAAGTEARIVEASWFGDHSVPLPLGRAFHARRLTLRSSQVGRLPPARAPRWDHRRRMALALALLRDPTYEALITHECAFDDLPAVLARIVENSAGVLCQRIRYPETRND